MFTRSTCWTRTVKGHLWDRRKDLEHLYQMFDLFKENSRVLAEGNFYFRGHTKLKLSSCEEFCTGELSPTLAIIFILHNMAFVMVCFYFPTPIPMLIPIPIRIQMANIITCRTVSTEPIPIPIQITILMQMGTVTQFDTNIGTDNVVFIAHKHSLRRLCFYRCLSVHGGGVCLIACWDATPPGSRHPPEAYIPKSRHTPWSRHPPPEAHNPLEADTPQEQTPPKSRHPPEADTPVEADTPPRKACC